MEKVKRVTKKQQYLNGLLHDFTWATGVINSGDSTAWYHGERKPLKWWIEFRKEVASESVKVETDKTYKPWIEF
jgi:hypothetical protein